MRGAGEQLHDGVAVEQIGHPSLPARAAVLLVELFEQKPFHVTICALDDDAAFVGGQIDLVQLSISGCANGRAARGGMLLFEEPELFLDDFKHLVAVLEDGAELYRLRGGGGSQTRKWGK